MQTLIGAEHNSGGLTLGFSAEQVDALEIVKDIWFQLDYYYSSQSTKTSKKHKYMYVLSTRYAYKKQRNIFFT